MTLWVHIFFPVGTDQECKEYIRNCENGQFTEREKELEKKLLKSFTLIMDQKIKESERTVRQKVLKEVEVIYGSSGVFGDKTNSILAILLLIASIIMALCVLWIRTKLFAVKKTLRFWKKKLHLEKILRRHKVDADEEAAQGESLAMKQK